jgi:hypothetical protein
VSQKLKLLHTAFKNSAAIENSDLAESRLTQKFANLSANSAQISRNSKFRSSQIRQFSMKFGEFVIPD